MTKKAVKKKRPGLAPVKKVFTAPENPATWRPTPLQMEIYVEICRGVAPWKIARKLKTTTTQLQEMCDQIDEFLVNQSISDIRNMRQRMQTRLECLFITAMESFELSKNPTKTTESGKTANGDFHKEKVTENASGEAAFLSIARQCFVDLRDLWAMDKKTADEGGKEEFRITGGTRLDAMKSLRQRLTIQIERVEKAGNE